MYFYFIKGKQHLDLTGNLILSHNDALIKARVPSAAPKIKNGRYIISTKGFIRKVKATWNVMWFIWGDYSEALDISNTMFDQPYRKEK